MPEKIYICKKCGIAAKQADGLCQPVPQQDINAYCGVTDVHTEVCATGKEKQTIVCASCGRPAQDAELVCNPLGFT